MSTNDSQKKISVKMILFQYFQAVSFVLSLRTAHFKHESLLWSLRKYFCELFPEKIFNFHELSELDYLRKCVRRPDEQPAMLCTEEEIDAGGKFIKE